MTEIYRLAADGIAATFEADCGFIATLTVRDGGRDIAMLHRAPWIGQAMPPDAAPHLARLAGDFFCAPFGMAGAEGAPLHGWPANAHWMLAASAPDRLHMTLDRPVMGARLAKDLVLMPGSPFLYQTHTFIGGTGTVPVANHAMLAVPDGALLSFSPRAWFETAPDPQESDPARGRSALAYPARGTDPTRFPTADGGTTDLTRYPIGHANEDFVIAVEDAASTLGWTAVVRPAQGDLFLSLRDPRALPLTMMWHSNGGRHYEPWSSRHAGVLGIEEGAARHLRGVSARQSPDPLDARGSPSGLTLVPDGTAETRHAIGCMAWPTGARVATVTLAGDRLTVTGDDGHRRILPFLPGFLPG
jgi:hypothetical protein